MYLPTLKYLREQQEGLQQWQEKYDGKKYRVSTRSVIKLSKCQHSKINFSKTCFITYHLTYVASKIVST